MDKKTPPPMTNQLDLLDDSDAETRQWVARYHRLRAAIRDAIEEMRERGVPGLPPRPSGDP